MQINQFISTKTRKAINNHFVIVDDAGDISFQSYDKVAVKIGPEKSKIIIYSNWNYSPTTCKHFLNFMCQHLNWIFSEADIKKMLAAGNFNEIPVEYVEH